MCRMVSWDQLQNYLLPISNHVSVYIPEQWNGTRGAWAWWWLLYTRNSIIHSIDSVRPNKSLLLLQVKLYTIAMQYACVVLTPTTLRRRQNTGRATWYIAETGIAMEKYIIILGCFALVHSIAHSTVPVQQIETPDTLLQCMGIGMERVSCFTSVNIIHSRLGISNKVLKLVLGYGYRNSNTWLTFRWVTFRWDSIYY